MSERDFILLAIAVWLAISLWRAGRHLESIVDQLRAITRDFQEAKSATEDRLSQISDRVDAVKSALADLPDAIAAAEADYKAMTGAD